MSASPLLLLAIIALAIASSSGYAFPRRCYALGQQHKASSSLTAISATGTSTPIGADGPEVSGGGSSGSGNDVEKYRTRSLLTEAALKKLMEKCDYYAAANTALEERAKNLTQELADATAQLRVQAGESADMEREYERELSRRLEASIGELRRSDSIDRAGSANLLLAAGKEVGELRALLKDREEQISALQAQLKQGSMGGDGSVSAVQALSQRAVVYEYLVAGDLREQRRLLERQSAMLASLSERLPSPAPPGTLHGRVRGAAQAVLHSLAFLVGKGPYAGAFDAERASANPGASRALPEDGGMTGNAFPLADTAFNYDAIEIENN